MKMKEEKIMKKKATALAALVLAAATLITGCSAGNSQTASSPSANSDATPAAAYAPLTFDNYGRKVTVTKKPAKVLALGPNTCEVMVALGLTDYIVGTTLKNHSRGPLPEYKDAVEKVPVLNYQSATREAVLSSGADFVYGIDWEFGGDKLDISELEKYGMTVYLNSATTIDQTYQEILDMGKIFQVEDKAAALVSDQKARVKAVQDKIKAAGKEPVSVLVYDSGNDGVFTASGVNYETLLIELAGGKNVFGDITEKAWTTVNYEAVLERNPDVILIHDYDSPPVDEKKTEIETNDTLSKLDCVKNKHYAVIELESVLPGDRIAYTVEKLAAAFYPDLFEA